MQKLRRLLSTLIVIVLIAVAAWQYFNNPSAPDSGSTPEAPASLSVEEPETEISTEEAAPSVPETTKWVRPTFDFESEVTLPPQTDPPVVTEPNTPQQTDPPTTKEQTAPPQTTGPPVTTEVPTTVAPTTTKTPVTTEEPTTVAPTTTKAPATTAAPTTTAKSGITVDRNGEYDDKDHVALYIHTYGKLPSNYITKKQAQNLGWSGGSLEKYAPGKSIGGSRFGNNEGRLPAGHTYYECDIDTRGKKSRGAKRIVYSSDGLIYYTDDHYETFERLY